MENKKTITIAELYNEMGSMYSDLMNKMEDLRHELTELVENKLKTDEPQVENNTICDADYVTITGNDVFVAGEVSKTYNGQDIYNYYHLPAYFKEIRDDVAEKGINLLEIHCLQSSTDGEYAEKGNPTPDKNGCSAWCRCVWEKDGEKHIGAWVFSHTFSSAANCAYYCASYCADGVRGSASFRSAVFGLQD